VGSRKLSVFFSAKPCSQVNVRRLTQKGSSTTCEESVTYSCGGKEPWLLPKMGYVGLSNLLSS
jgi:hypothetical protein